MNNLYLNKLLKNINNEIIMNNLYVLNQTIKIFPRPIQPIIFLNLQYRLFNE